EQGEVSIRVELETENEHTARVRFSIRDTGVGIDPRDADRLFQPFTQADISTTRKYGGTGLGLSIAKSLVEMMDGSIGVESTPGTGSTFWFAVPFAKTSSGAIQAPHYKMVDVTGLRVLSVDDNGTNRSVLSGFLESWGCRHTEVECAHEAMRVLRESVEEGDPFRIAILDMQMPDVDGETLGATIRANPELRDTRLVMMTSAAARGDARRMQDVGFSAYLTKPIKQAQFHDCLAAVAGRMETVEADSDTPRPIITRHSLAERSNHRVRILIAEDNVVNQKVALKTLEKLGYGADVVSDGAEAVEAMHYGEYGLVLMDVQMPGMDGMEATQRIRDPRSGALNPRTPIIALTAHAMLGDRQRCLDAGMDDFLSKPLRSDELAAVVSRWLGSTPFDEERTAEQEGSSESWTQPLPDENTGLSQPVIDDMVLLALFDGDTDAAAEVVADFSDHVPRQLAELRAAAIEGALDRVREGAHTLRGASASVGASTLSGLSGTLERCAATGAGDEVLRLLDSIEEQVRRLEQHALQSGAPR
ncbi:MAG: response regulator, partial [Rhodothermales bacterium]